MSKQATPTLPQPCASAATAGRCQHSADSDSSSVAGARRPLVRKAAIDETDCCSILSWRSIRLLGAVPLALRLSAAKARYDAMECQTVMCENYLEAFSLHLPSPQTKKRKHISALESQIQEVLGGELVEQSLQALPPHCWFACLVQNMEEAEMFNCSIAT
nr:hypothetical protein Iba_chr10cCG9220 [Ipomoea batatas]